MAAALETPNAYSAEKRTETLRYVAQGSSILEASKIAGVSYDAVRQWVFKYRIPEIRDIAKDAVDFALQRALKGSVGRDVRERLALVVKQEVDLLYDNPPQYVGELGNTPEGQGRAAIIKTVIESASEVFGWGKEHGNIDSLRSANVIDVSEGKPSELLTEPSINQPAQEPESKKA